MAMVQKVISACCGTYDGLLHEGHIHFLQQARKHGELYVFIVPDEVVRRNKHREPLFSQAKRAQHVKVLGIATAVIPLAGNDSQQLAQVQQLKPTTYCFSDDQNTPWDIELEKLLCKQGANIIRILRYKPEKYSTTKLHFST